MVSNGNLKVKIMSLNHDRNLETAFIQRARNWI